MMANLTPWQRRLLAVALLLGVLALVGVAVAIPVVIMHRHYVEAQDEQLDRLRRYQRVVNARPQIEKQLAEVNTKDTAKYFLKNYSPALAATEIQEVAQTIIESFGGKLASMQVNTHKDEGGFRQISLNVQLSGNLVALQKILHALETSEPYLFIDNLSLRSPLGRQSRPIPGVEPEFNMQFDLFGYAAGPKS